MSVAHQYVDLLSAIFHTALRCGTPANGGTQSCYNSGKQQHKQHSPACSLHQQQQDVPFRLLDIVE